MQCDSKGFQGDGRGEAELCLESQQLTAVPPSVLSGSASITIMRLNLSRNELRVVPNELYSLRSLVRLDLSRNHLAALPAGISRLGALQDLILLRYRYRSGLCIAPSLHRIPCLLLAIA